MSLLFATLVSLSTQAQALEPIKISYGGCGPMTYPCIGVYQGDFTIVPPDWFESWDAALGGNFNYFRIEVIPYYGSFDVLINGRYMTDGYYSARESIVRDVYYFPATPDAEWEAVNLGTRGGIDFDLSVTGASTLPGR